MGGRVDRLDTLKARAEFAAQIDGVAMSLNGGGIEWLRSYTEDVPWLIARVEELEREVEEKDDYIASLEDEIQERTG